MSEEFATTACLCWQVKRDMFEMGYQPTYDSMFEFAPLIGSAVVNLAPEVRASLCEERRVAKGDRGEISDAKFVATYTLLILEGVRARAWAASHRTKNWW